MRAQVSILLAVFTLVAAATLFDASSARAEKAATIEKNSRDALALLLKNSEGAKGLVDDAVGIMVFPEIVKGGLIIGGLYGEGALLKGDDVAGYYSTGAASFGLQAGLQTFGYAMFFLTEDAMKYLDNADGWELGTAPHIVVVDTGASGKLSTASGRSNTYVFFFDQKGLMAGLGIEGTKISKIDPD